MASIGLSTSIQFLDPGPLVDGDLELIPPQPKEIDAILLACRHPATLAEASDQVRLTRQGLLDFLEAAPLGHHPGSPAHGRCPCYHFWMRLSPPDPLRIAGTISLRLGDDDNIRMYVGHIGYNVYPPARGRHLAERSARLLFPLAHRHGFDELWITCNPDNIPSRRTCQRLGAQLVEIVPVPKTHELYQRGDREKCRFRLYASAHADGIGGSITH